VRVVIFLPVNIMVIKINYI